MKVKGKKEVFFNKLGWGITKGETKELPENEKDASIILCSGSVDPVNNIQVQKNQKKD